MTKGFLCTLLPYRGRENFFDPHYSLRNFQTISLRRNPDQKDGYNSAVNHKLRLVMHYFMESHDLRAGMALIGYCIKIYSHGFMSMWNKVLGVFCRCEKIEHARHFFDEMPERDVVSFNTLISSYLSRERNIVEAQKVYCRMLAENVMPSYITLSVLISASPGSMSRYSIEQIHGQAIKFHLNNNEFVGSSLVDKYSKCLLLNEAMQAFNEIAKPDLVSYNIMIDGCTYNNKEEHAWKMLLKMQQNEMKFDSFTLTSILKICFESRHLNFGKQLHCRALKDGLCFETPTHNALITMYSKCEEGMVSSMKVFSIIPTPDIISWTSVISGFMQNGMIHDAIRHYQKMLQKGVRENEFSFASILPACGSLANLEQGRQIHARIIKFNNGSDVSIANALIDMYHKCGKLDYAHLIFSTMMHHDVITFTIMITGLGHHGMGKEALEVYKMMKIKGLKPDSVTFLGILSACSHAGFVNEGIQIFESMVFDHCIKPTREHYACVIDMFGRSGKLSNAERFVRDMGIESDVFVWETLLGACKIHGKIELGERCAKKIMELGLLSDGGYVLLSNIYAEKGMWEEKGRIRENLDTCGLRKEAGFSFVGSAM